MEEAQSLVGRSLAYWWIQNIANLRNWFAAAKIELKTDIIKAGKRACFEGLCQRAVMNPWGDADKDVTRTIGLFS